MEKIKIQVMVDEDQLSKIKKVAKSEGLMLGTFLRRTVILYCNNHNSKIYSEENLNNF